MGAVRTAPQRGWLEVAFDDGDFDRKWVVMDNGVIWVHRDRECLACAVFPLHDAEVSFSSTNRNTFSVKLTVHRLHMRAGTEHEYHQWTTAMLEAAQLWHARRQMALMAVLPAVADLAVKCTSRQPVALRGLAEGRMLVVQCLAQFVVQAGELRARTRRAVTQSHCDADLPRFLRRAIADAVEKIWKACARARSCADATGRGGDAAHLAVYDGVLVLREAVHAFVTYCNLLRDLEKMLRGAETDGDDPLAFSPICCLSGLRDVLHRLGALIRGAEEQTRQRAALAALDAVLQRCWTELSEQLDQAGDAGSTVSSPSPSPRPRTGALPEDSSQLPSQSKGARSVRRLASRLQRDVVRFSVRRARKRARIEGQALLHDSIELASVPSSLECSVASVAAATAATTAISAETDIDLDPEIRLGITPAAFLHAATSHTHTEVTANATTEITPEARPRPGEAPGDVSTDTPSEALTQLTDETRFDETPCEMPVDETPTPDSERRAMTPDRTPDSRRRVEPDGASIACDGSMSTLPAPDPLRRRPDLSLWRRRRLVCSVGDINVGRNEETDDFEDPSSHAPEGEPQIKAKWAERNYKELQETNEAKTEEVKEKSEGKKSNPLVKSDPGPGLLDVPVTPATPNGGGRRALWCETREVQQSGLLDRLNTSESALQEAKFEVLSSEESYLRALDTLAHRVQAIEALQDPTVIADHDRDAVCKFLDSARACSLRFVSALRALWSVDMLLRGLCTLMHKEASPGASLQQYLHIVALQPRAASALLKIGSLEAVQLVPLLSLPAQRASRLPLLLAAILRRLDQRTSEAVICRAALDRLNQIVFECNEALRRAEQSERMAELGRMLFEDKSSAKKASWRERKNSVVGRAKSFFLKSNRRISTKVLTSASSMLNLT